MPMMLDSPAYSRQLPTCYPLLIGGGEGIKAAHDAGLPCVLQAASYLLSSPYWWMREYQSCPCCWTPLHTPGFPPRLPLTSQPAPRHGSQFLNDFIFYYRYLLYLLLHFFLQKNIFNPYFVHWTFFIQTFLNAILERNFYKNKYF